MATAKLILQDGNLQEYPYPVKVSHVLQKHPSSFICNSDDMDFDDVVRPIPDDHDLVPGQLYFALPLARLRRPLQPEEMAALAVKASSALSKSGGEKCGCRRKSVISGSFKSDVKPSSRRVADGGGVGVRNGGARSRRNFPAALSAIPE